MPAPIHDEADAGLVQAHQQRSIFEEQRKPGDPNASGDYVFLQEIVADADAFTFEFTDIPQTYRHLKFEGAVSSSETDAPAYPYSGVAFYAEVDWAGGAADDYTYLFRRQWYQALNSPNVPATPNYPYQHLTEGSDTSVMRIDHVLPDKFWGRTKMGLLFRYYSSTDDQKMLRVEAEASDENYDSHAVFLEGSASLGPDNTDPDLWVAPITAVTISAQSGFSEGSRFSMYGIR